MSNTIDAALLAEANQALAATSSKTIEVPTAKKPEDEWWSTNNAMTMCAVLLAFGVVVMLLTTYLLKIGKPASSVLRVFGTILVVVMATFLVVAGYDQEQIGAPLGLLGTIVGYLLGKDSSARGDLDTSERPS